MMNFNKPYGTVHNADDGAVYVQNGIVYDSDGNPVNNSSIKESFDEPVKKRMGRPKNESSEVD